MELKIKTTKEENEDLQRKAKMIEDRKRREEMLALIRARKKIDEFERKISHHQEKQKSELEKIRIRNEKRMKRFIQAKTIADESEIARNQSLREKFEKKELLIMQNLSNMRDKREFNKEVKRMKSEGVSENLQRIERVKVKFI